jgi:hypothetical protein
VRTAGFVTNLAMFDMLKFNHLFRITYSDLQYRYIDDEAVLVKQVNDLSLKFKIVNE